jgi:hypothetical protein
MEDGVTIAVCLKRAGKGNIPGALKAHQNLRFVIASFTNMGTILIRSLDPSASKRFKRLANRPEISGTRLTGRRPRRTPAALGFQERIGYMGLMPSNMLKITLRLLQVIPPLIKILRGMFWIKNGLPWLK